MATSFPSVVFSADQNVGTSSIEDAFRSGPVEYTADFVFIEGIAYLELKPISDSAFFVDSLANAGVEAAWSETATHVQEIGMSSNLSGLSARATSVVLVNEALGLPATSQPDDWTASGLSVGYSAVPNQVPVAAASQEWFGGTVFLAPSDSFPSDAVEVASFNDNTVAGLSVARMREIAQQAANEMFSQAAQAGCMTKPRPQEISPSLSVSFNLFAGAEFSISATFVGEDLCDQLGIQ